MKTTVPLKGGYMGFHVSLGECKVQGLRVKHTLVSVLGFRVMEATLRHFGPV